MSVKPYFWPEDNYDVKPDKLETPVEIPVEIPVEVPIKPDEPETTTELDELGVPLPILEAP